MISLLPVANIVDIPTIILIIGQTILIALKAALLTKRATKIVSIIVYNPIKTIIVIVGKANLSKKFSDIF